MRPQEGAAGQERGESSRELLLLRLFTRRPLLSGVSPEQGLVENLFAIVTG